MRSWYKILLIALVIYNVQANAQIKGIINYKFTISDKEFPSNSVNYIVYLSNNKSIEIATASAIKTQDIDERTRTVVIKGKEGFVFKDFKIKKMILADYLGIRTQLITDTLQNFKWTITREKRKISKFNCIKATTKFRGRNYIAWFTEDVPVQNGPWKFCGLPGLIVNLNDNELIFNYELTGINLKAKFNDNIVSIPYEYTKDKAISHNQFIKRYHRAVLNNKKMANVVETGNDGSVSSGEIVLPIKMEKF